MKQWKVGTITMGLLLIIVGAASLLSQINGMSIIESVLKWWPAALIILGLEVLVFSFLSNNENVRMRFDGFSIFVIIVILLFSSGAYTVQSVFKGDLPHFFMSFSNNSRFRTELSKNFNIDMEGRNKLVIDNKLGEVVVEKGTGKEIEVYAQAVIGSNDEEYARTLTDSIISVTKDTGVNIRSNSPGSTIDRYKVQSVTINYRIKVPENVSVEIWNKFGRVNALDIKGDLKIDNSNGAVEVSKVSGNLKVETKFGKSEISDVAGNLEFSGSNGEVIIRTVGGTAKVSNKFGKIEIKNVGKILQVDNSNGEILVENDKTFEEDVTIDNKFGRITLKMPQSQQGSFKCYTRFGKVNTSLPLTLSSEHKTDSSAEGKVGTGKVNFRINNSNGDIDIRD